MANSPQLEIGKRRHKGTEVSIRVPSMILSRRLFYLLSLFIKPSSILNA